MHMYPSIHPPNRYIHLSTSSSDVFSSLQEITRAFQVLSNEGTVEELHIYPSIHPPNKHLPIYQHPLLVFSLPFRRSRAPSKCSPMRGRSRSCASHGTSQRRAPKTVSAEAADREATSQSNKQRSMRLRIARLDRGHGAAISSLFTLLELLCGGVRRKTSR